MEIKTYIHSECRKTVANVNFQTSKNETLQTLLFKVYRTSQLANYSKYQTLLEPFYRKLCK